MRINGNSSDGIQRSLDRVNRQLESSYSKLASGSKIARAGGGAPDAPDAPDASGLARSEQLRALIESLDAAGRNASDGVSLARTSEAALGEVGESLGRMRELAIQASNDTLSESDRAAIQDEFVQLSSEIDRVASDTEFNGVHLLDGSEVAVSIQAGTDASAAVDVDLARVTAADLGLDDEDLSSAAGAAASLEDIDAALETVSSARADFGVSVDRLESSYRSVGATKESLESTESRIRDVDVAVESARLAHAQILQEGAGALFTQANASSAAAAQFLA